MVVNKLFSETAFQGAVVAFAKRQLDRLLQQPLAILPPFEPSAELAAQLLVGRGLKILFLLFAYI